MFFKHSTLILIYIFNFTLIVINTLFYYNHVITIITGAQGTIFTIILHIVLLTNFFFTY